MEPAMRYLICLILALTFAAAPAFAICRELDEPFPPTTAGQCARDFLATLNNPTPDSVRGFETRWASKARLARSSVEQRVSSLSEMHQDLGTLKVTRVTTSDPLTVFATSAREEMAFQFLMSPTEADKLDSVQIMPASEVAEAKPLTPELRASTVDGVARALREGYVFPPIGDKMAASIQAKLKAGDYDKLESDQALAARLTSDCRAISNDKHLGIRPAPSSSSARSMHMGENPRRGNFGFKKVEILPGNIGYLRFDMFHDGKEAFEVASSAMNFLANTDAIIFDMRYNGGGSPAMIRHITSYLFEKSTHLNDMVDRDGKTVEEYWTFEKVSGRRPGAGIPLYVLTSSRTFSGAEEFTYNLQNLERATIVGETTGGGAHPVRMNRVNDRFAVGIPYMRAQNPITHTNWEGKGVEPDVKTSAESALDKALELARAAVKK